MRSYLDPGNFSSHRKQENKNYITSNMRSYLDPGNFSYPRKQQNKRYITSNMIFYLDPGNFSSPRKQKNKRYITSNMASYLESIKLQFSQKTWKQALYYVQHDILSGINKTLVLPENRKISIILCPTWYPT